MLPFVAATVILAGGIATLGAAGAFSDDGPAVRSGVELTPPPASARSPWFVIPSSEPAPVPSITTPATPTDTPSSSASPTPSPSPRPAPSPALPSLSDLDPTLPATETMVTNSGLIVAVYRVKPWDYLSAIADTFHTSLTDVYEWSKGNLGPNPNPNLIYEGQPIVVKVLGKV